jgi:nucleoside-diphosphate-sugar epimerase
MSIGASIGTQQPPRSEAELDEILSRPTPGVLEALRLCPGDVLVLGAAGKMGPTLTLMLRRAADELADGRRIYAVSRFSSNGAAKLFSDHNVEVIPADLSDRTALAMLPEAPNVIFMAGQKFGTRSLPALTWVSNVIVPAMAAERYREARFVAFSTGNVYGLTSRRRGGSKETDTLSPAGEYAWSCLGRERILEHASRSRDTRTAIIRLNYAIELRYGVLVDLAQRVHAGEAIDVRMGHVNLIWQGDACAQAIQSLTRVSVPPFILNVTGTETLSVRALALELGRLLGREPVFIGQEEDDALLSNTELAQSLFGPPSVPVVSLLSWVAEWVSAGRPTLGKPTKFEEREGNF